MTIFSYGDDSTEFSLMTGLGADMLLFFGTALFVVSGIDYGSMAHHCLAFDSGKVSYYFEGVLAREESVVLDTGSTYNLNFGARRNGNKLTGAIDNAVIYASALSAARVASVRSLTMPYSYGQAH